MLNPRSLNNWSSGFGALLGGRPTCYLRKVTCRPAGSVGSSQVNIIIITCGAISFHLHRPAGLYESRGLSNGTCGAISFHLHRPAGLCESRGLSNETCGAISFHLHRPAGLCESRGLSNETCGMISIKYLRTRCGWNGWSGWSGRNS